MLGAIVVLVVGAVVVVDVVVAAKPTDVSVVVLAGVVVTIGTVVVGSFVRPVCVTVTVGAVAVVVVSKRVGWQLRSRTKFVTPKAK